VSAPRLPSASVAGKPPAQWLMVARVTAPRLSEIEGAGVPTTRSAIDIGREAAS